MYIGGEVIMTQALLTQMEAASVRSVIVAHRPDEAIKAALTQHADSEVRKTKLGPCSDLLHLLPAFGTDLALNRRFFKDVAEADRAAGF